MSEYFKNNAGFASGRIAINEERNHGRIRRSNQTQDLKNLKTSSRKIGDQIVQADGFFE